MDDFCWSECCGSDRRICDREKRRTRIVENKQRKDWNRKRKWSADRVKIFLKFGMVPCTFLSGLIGPFCFRPTIFEKFTFLPQHHEVTCAHCYESTALLSSIFLTPVKIIERELTYVDVFAAWVNSRICVMIWKTLHFLLWIGYYIYRFVEINRLS